RDFTEFFGRDIFDALERIARGDFNVFVPSHEHDPLAGLAESVNRMARQLGTVESQRQQFITDVSHEIQSPLTSISGFAALLRDSALTEEQRLHYLGIIEQESRRLSHLADNLLRLAALDSEDQQAERTHYALDEQLRSVILTLEPQWTARNVSVELVTEQTKPNTDADIKAAESEPEVNREAAGSEPGANPGSTEYGATPLAFDGDQELMEQVWINLIGNAIKFTPEGGKVTVSVERVGAAWVVRVIDTGIGVTEEDLLHIFERFYRADKARGRSQGGNGLGLPLARRIVELHGGSIDVASDPDHGSTFTVTL
ncbi:MAG: HAMP domain-containing histidine kinase, partial [Coriobacteriales bacterium]|nr:HAMP domain-containing histidine kinase [Coriobacteriales bacterium]